MHTFKPGDFANILRNGQEITVNIMGEVINGYCTVGRYDDGMFSGRKESVLVSTLLPLRGPYFEIRGQVLTTSPFHANEVGEIVGTGTSKSGKLFFNVRFGDGKNEWFNEDQVFIDDEENRKYTEAVRDESYFK